MSDNVTELPRALSPAQRKLVEDPDLQLMVADLAAHYAHRVNRRIEERDFFQAGMEGASRAARRFNPSGGASFKTYAWSDIRGAMCALITAATRAARIVDRGATKYLEDVPDDAGPNDTPEHHAQRLKDFSNGFNVFRMRLIGWCGSIACQSLIGFRNQMSYNFRVGGRSEVVSLGN